MYVPLKTEPQYGINRNGDVINLKTGHSQRQYISTNGYLSVSLGLARKVRHIHRLLGECFLENPDNLRVVHHKDHNKLNNSLDNLEWASHSKNTKESYLNGRVRGWKITDEMRDRIVSAKGEIASSYWARKFGVSARHIRHVIAGTSRPLKIRSACHS
jgi:hypothetical protein